MTYTAKLLDKQPEGLNTRVYVEFSSGSEAVKQDFVVEGEEGFKSEVRNRIDKLEKQDSFRKGLKGGNIDVSPVVVAPTPKELKLREYELKLEKLMKLKKLLDLGVVETSTLDLLRGEVKSLATELGEI